MPFKRTAKKTYDEESLYEYAIGALGRRMRTVAEIKRLMRNRVAAQPDGEALIETVVARLKAQHYLNDTSYAESYSRFRQENEKFGRLRVVQDLKIKGVHGDIIEKVVGASLRRRERGAAGARVSAAQTDCKTDGSEAGCPRFSYTRPRPALPAGSSSAY